LYTSGSVQLLAASASSQHWKVEPFSFELKPKLALVEVVVLAGPELIDVLGGVVSAAGGGSTGA
jgi:hypothetical protein